MLQSQTVLVQDGRITAVGPSAEVQELGFREIKVYQKVSRAAYENDTMNRVEGVPV